MCICYHTYDLYEDEYISEWEFYGANLFGLIITMITSCYFGAAKWYIRCALWRCRYCQHSRMYYQYRLISDTSDILSNWKRGLFPLIYSK